MDPGTPPPATSEPLTTAGREAAPSFLQLAQVVGGAFLLWRFAWDNARIGAGPTDFRLLPIPRAARFLEMAALLALFAVLALRVRTTAPARRTGMAFLLCVVLLGVISTIVAVSWGLVALLPALQVVYAFSAPLILCLVVGLLARRPGDTSVLVAMLVAAVMVNAAVAWYQFAVEGLVGDYVHGAMRDAHHFASVVWLVVLLLVARLASRAGRAALNLLGMAVLVPVALVAANEKANAAFGGALLLAAALWLWRRGWIARLVVVGGLAGVIAVFGGIMSGGLTLPAPLERYALVAQNLSSTGLVEGYRKLGTVVAENPRVLVLGTGPGSYGSSKALDQVVLGGVVPPLAARYTAESYRLGFLGSGRIGSYMEESTDLSAFFVEFGPLALVLFGAAVWALLVTPARAAVARGHPDSLALGRWVQMSVAYLVLVSALTAFYGWSSVDTTTWSLAIVAAMLADGT